MKELNFSQLNEQQKDYIIKEMFQGKEEEAKEYTYIIENGNVMLTKKKSSDQVNENKDQLINE